MIALKTQLMKRAAALCLAVVLTLSVNAAALFGGCLLYTSSGRLDGCGHTGGGGGPVLLSVYGGTVCRQRHLSLLSVIVSYKIIYSSCSLLCFI